MIDVRLGQRSISVHQRRLSGSVLDTGMFPFSLCLSFSMFGEFLGRITAEGCSQDGAHGPQYQSAHQRGMLFSFHLRFPRMNGLACFHHWVVLRCRDGNNQLMMMMIVVVVIFQQSTRGVCRWISWRALSLGCDNQVMGIVFGLEKKKQE